MNILILGLVIFLGVHSTRMLAPTWRDAQIARLGELQWKALFSVISLVGFALLIYGYGEARLNPVVVWVPPVWLRHVPSLLMLVAFLCIAATYVPGNRIKAKIGHPMLAGVKTWAFAHLLVNGNLADILLFGSFLIWSVAEFRTFRQRDKAAGVTYPHGPVIRDIITVILGLGAYGVFMGVLHTWLIGVRPY